MKFIKVNLFTDQYRYFYNDEKKIVIAKLENPFYLFDSWITNSTYHNDCITQWIYSDTLETMQNSTLHYGLVAKAVCAEGDTYDREVGKKIAMRKLQLKVSELWCSYFRHVQEYLANQMDDAREMRIAAVAVNHKMADHFIEDVERLTGGNEN